MSYLHSFFFFFWRLAKFWPVGRRYSRQINVWEQMMNSCVCLPWKSVTTVAHPGWRRSRRCYFMLASVAGLSLTQLLDARFAPSHPRADSERSTRAAFPLLLRSVVVFPPAERWCFEIHVNTLFANPNPHHQSAGRKGGRATPTSPLCPPPPTPTPRPNCQTPSQQELYTAIYFISK